ncbi:MAG: signal peptidase II [Blautia sp.]|nr:signal peptidase II [Blautia sp.]
MKSGLQHVYKPLPYYLVCVAVSAFLFAGDQMTKHLARVFLMQKDDVKLIPGVLHLHYLYPENRGIAFGLMQGGTTVTAVLTVVLMAMIAYVFIRIPRTKKYLWLTAICILLFSGAAGNLTDRLARGFVIDFIYFVLIDFPVFNVADMYVVVGAFLLFITTLWVYKDDEDFAFLKG